MKSTALATWGLAEAILLAVGGGILGWTAMVIDQPASRQILLAVAVLLCGAAVTLLVWTAAARVSRDADQQKLDKYACPRCGYAPKSEQLESESAFPCPTCGEPIYGE